MLADTAKNIIMFLGDGMSVPTLAAARVYLGSLQNASGEELSLSFENFPYSGLSKVILTPKFCICITFLIHKMCVNVIV